MNDGWTEQTIRSARPRFDCSGLSHLVATPDGEALIALDGSRRVHRFAIASRTSTLLTTEVMYRGVLDLTVLPDGRVLMLSTYSTSAGVHELRGGALVPLVELAGAGGLDMRGGVAAFAPGFDRCVFFTKREARIYDLASGTCCETKRFRVGPTESKFTPVDHRLIRTPDGGLMAALGDKPPVALVGPPVALPPEVAALDELVFSRDGRLALGRSERGLELIRLGDDGARPVAERPGFYGAAALAPGGELWATVEDTAVILRDTTTGAPLHAEQGLPPLSIALYLAVAAGGDGRRTVLASDGKTIWCHERGAEGEERTIAAGGLGAAPGAPESPFGPSVQGLHLSADGRSMAASIGGGRIQLLSLNGRGPGRVVGPPVIEDDRSWQVRGLTALSPDFRRLASLETDDLSVSVFDVETGEATLILLSEEATVYALAFSLDGETLIIGSDRLRLRDASTGRERRRLELGLAATVHAVTTSKCGRWIAAGGLVDDDFHHDGAGESAVWLWDLESDDPGPTRTWRHSPFLRPWFLDDGGLIGARHEKGEVWRIDPAADEPTTPPHTDRRHDPCSILQ